MIKFLDGPAAGQILALRRAPIFLRVAFNPMARRPARGKDRQWDALDAMDDVAKEHEQLFVYIANEPPGSVHLCCRPRSAGGWFATGTYRLSPDQPDPSILHDNAAYYVWVNANADRLLPDWAKQPGIKLLRPETRT